MAPVEFLITHRLTRQYGGLTAVNEVNFSLRHDRIHAIIGPNGAGKTTLVNLICGREKPTSGSIVYKGKEISQQSSAKRVQSGIVYTFQVTSIFNNLSCYEKFYGSHLIHRCLSVPIIPNGNQMIVRTSIMPTTSR